MKWLIIAGGVVLVASGLTWSLLFSPKELTYQGRTMHQWLQILKSDSNTIDSPLRILGIIKFDGEQVYGVEVPMSYDRLMEHDFLQMSGKFTLIVNGRVRIPHCAPATNGNCVLEFGEDDLRYGSNQIQARFDIFIMDRLFFATGPETELVSTNLLYVSPYLETFGNKGVFLQAKARGDNAHYHIELMDTNGRHIKTFENQSKDGNIEELWDVTDASGNGYTGKSIKVLFQVTIPTFPTQMIEQEYYLEGK